LVSLLGGVVSTRKPIVTPRKQGIAIRQYGAPLVVLGAPLTIDADAFKTASGDLESSPRMSGEEPHAYGGLTKPRPTC